MKRPNLVPRHHSSRRRAAVAVMTAVTLVVLLIFASFAVDLGFVRAVCGDMQHTADAAALAGASALREVDEADPELVKERAVEMIELMQKSQGFEALADQVIQVGKWDYETGEFTPLEPGARSPFAVRVVSVRKKTPLFFAAVMGKYSTDVTREAVSLGSGRCGGIWGLNGVRVIGDVVTDSYNADEGAYSADTAGDNGDICSGRNVTVNGGVEVNGDVMCGFAYEVTINGSSAEISGTTTANSGPVTGPVPDFGNITSVNDDVLIPATDGGKPPWRAGLGWNLYLTANDNVNVPPGDYYMDSITMRSGATITVSGKTTFYVGGKVDALGAGIVNQTADPSNLSIISKGTSFEIGGTADLYGSVLAPYAAVKLHGDSNFYGALIGGTVEMLGNFQFHVDESLPIVDFFDPPMPSLVK
ncbi:MAG: pilus assembly protein TadG-related protein [Planctomycetota bacterium]